MGGVHRDIQQYQKIIHEYNKRRAIYKEKYGRESLQYTRLSAKVYNYNKAVKRIKNINDRIKKLSNDIYEFMGQDIQRTKDPKTKEGKAAKGIFLKYGMQNGLYGVDLGKYIGIKGDWSAARYRIRFTKSFSTNNYNKQTYHSFLKFIKRKN